MRITKKQINITLGMLQRAGEVGVHEFYISCNASCKNPRKIIEILKRKGYQFKEIPWVQLGISQSLCFTQGMVYVLLEDQPRKYLGWDFTEDETGSPIAKQVEIDNSPKQLILV